MATAVIVYIPVAYLADRSTKKPYVAITFVFFTLFPLVLLYSRSFEMLIVAFIHAGTNGVWRTNPESINHGSFPG
jgi:hypothetical protein